MVGASHFLKHVTFTMALTDEVVDVHGSVGIDPVGEGREEQLEAKDSAHDSVIVPVTRKVVTSGAAVVPLCYGRPRIILSQATATATPQPPQAEL